MTQLASEFGVQTHQIQEWKKRLLEEAPAIFSTRRSQAERDTNALQAELYRQIAQLKVALDWLTAGVTGAKRRRPPQRRVSPPDFPRRLFESCSRHR